MEKIEQENYLNTKYSLDNLKKQKESILTNPTTFTGFDRIGSEKNVVIKTYYDTPDFFFHERGLTININAVKGSKNCDLVVRWDTGRERIRFLSNIPDTFVKKISVKDSIYSESEYIAECISQLVPNGLNVDISKLVNSLRGVVVVKKKRESYKYISINGLKINLHFSNAEFTTPLNRNKSTIYMLEVTSTDIDRQMDYDQFARKILFNNPTLIKLQNSDVKIGRENLFDKN